MSSTDYVPHIDLLLGALRINQDRLNSRSKVAVDAKLLRALIHEMVAAAPFSDEFYAATYPDIGEAHESGVIPDLQQHFIETGYFEGRLGCMPNVDEGFYRDAYPDVKEAIQRGDVASGAEHYERAGAAEGRSPNALARQRAEYWARLLRSDG